MLDLLHLDLDTAILEIQVAFSKFCWGNLCETEMVVKINQRMYPDTALQN
jgi:hypothetical protein